jgi:hypothetical protein
MPHHLLLVSLGRGDEEILGRLGPVDEIEVRQRS